MEYFAGEFDVAVIGAGHAGIEAALASARLGCETIIFATNLDSIGNLPCNPSIGGTAKGHLVREIDALGGEMGKAADKATIQSRMLNRGKGPAVHSLRVQVDRRLYSAIMKETLENQPRLLVKQAEIVDLRQISDNKWEVVTKLGALYRAKAVIIATGTFLGGRIFVGEVHYDSGPDGMFAATSLSQVLKNMGISLRRFKTGTPPRVDFKTIDLDKLEVQPGDEKVVPFSFETEEPPVNRAVCYITWTTQKTKEIILKNLHRSPMYSGVIEGIGARYCPSIEDKIVRFADKETHQLFIEPCGLNTREAYLQGCSTSLPEEVQAEMYRTIPGLENVQIMRTAYAIEYDCCDPLQLYPTLEFIKFKGLYGAGQFNGTSGYEEAAAQGLVAGINAALKIKGQPPLILERSGSYIGTLIDDLVTKGVADPYRMLTSRSEYRLVLRQDNADERLTPLGKKIGLVSDEKWEKFKEKQELKQQELRRLTTTVIRPSEEVNKILEKHGTTPIQTGVRLVELMRRPQLGYEQLKKVDNTRPTLPDAVMEQVETEIKYEGYIKRQLAQIKEAKRLEALSLPEDIDYYEITGLRNEAKEKLSKIRPTNIGQASRISGVNPADISVLIIWHKTRAAATKSDNILENENL